MNSNMIHFSDFRIIYRGGGMAAVLYHEARRNKPAYLCYRSSSLIASVIAGYAVCCCDDSKYQNQLCRLRDDVIKNGIIWFPSYISLYNLMDWPEVIPMQKIEKPERSEQCKKGGGK